VTLNLRSRFASQCKHFTGIQNDCCAVGVAYSPLRDISGPGMARWPCLTLVNRPEASTVCPRRELMTDADWGAHEGEVRAAIDSAFGKIAAGKCHVCGADAEPSRVVGRCRYAACGHRIGQEITNEEL
jgi:hypothetical protein